MAGWTCPYHLLHEEVIVLRDQGVAIPAALRDRIAALSLPADEWNYAAIDPLSDALAALPAEPQLAAAEPDDLAAIRRLRPEGSRDLGWQPTDDELIERLHGAWTGRAAGCALGKPVEGIGMSDRDGRPAGRRRIKDLLQRRGDWPLVDYVDGRDVGDGEHAFMGGPGSLRGTIAYMEPDDDIHYTLVGLGVIEEKGPTFAWSDVARFWLQHIPVSHICTAERQAILNFQNRSSIGRPGAATAEFCRRYRNPYREWIGAQIRSDGWAYVCAGRPELAAEFAWRDACWTHERNGIYGEMFFAAMQAAAFVVADPHELVRIGLGEIPRDCRLARAVRATVAVVSTGVDWETACTQVEDICLALSPTHHSRTGPAVGMSSVHTINNACICILALFLGRMHTRDSLSIAVMCGLDTDCNGASVGSIVGAAAGRAGFDRTLADPLHDTIKPAMVGFETVRMRTLAERCAVQWRRIAQWLDDGRPAVSRSSTSGGEIFGVGSAATG